MVKVRDKKLISTYGQRVLDAGFYSIPNLILDYQNELNLSDEELVFYIKVTHFYSKTRIDIEKLKMSHKRTSLFAIRKSLIEKGYLELIRLPESKVIIYDWSGLISVLNKIIQNMNSSESEQVSSESEQVSSESEIPSIIEKNLLKEDLKESHQKKENEDELLKKLIENEIKREEAQQIIEIYERKEIEQKIDLVNKIIEKTNIENKGSYLKAVIRNNCTKINSKENKETSIAKKVIKDYKIESLEDFKKRYDETIKKVMERKNGKSENQRDL